MAKQTLNNGDNLLVIRTKINDNTTELYTATSDAQADADAALNGLTNKVDKEAGKGLSTNDYTTTEKNKLAAIAPSATANATDAQLRDRSTHTGTQLAATISDFGSTVLAAVLTGISFATFTAITATDSILSALGKLQAQITANVTAIGNKVGNDADTYSASAKITQVISLSQAEYDAIATKNDAYLYIIV